MVHKILTTVGLTCDAGGAILVGVEAVKLENVRRFRGWLDRRGRGLFSVINPELVFLDADEPPPTGAESRATAVAFTAFIAGGLVLGGLVLFGLYGLSRSLGGPSVSALPWWGLALAALGAVFAALLLATLVVTVGQALLALTLRLIEQLDKHTPSGGVGMLGVALLVAGFALQVAATWIE